MGVEVVTLWLLSTDNLNRPASELTPLLAIIEGLVDDIANAGRWRVHPVGALDLLPADTARALKDAATRTADVPGLHVNVAVGYGGRREIADAVRALLHDQASKGTTIEDLANVLDVEHIAEHLLDLVGTGPPAARLRGAGRLGPPAVAVEDDPDVARDLLGVQRGRDASRVEAVQQVSHGRPA